MENRHIWAWCIIATICVLCAIVITSRPPRRTQELGKSEIANSREQLEVFEGQDIVDAPIYEEEHNEISVHKLSQNNQNSQTITPKGVRALHDIADDVDISSLPIPGLGQDSARYQRIKERFYTTSTPEQKKRGQALLESLRSVMGNPDNLKFQATFFTDDPNKPCYKVGAFYKSPHYYREDAKGKISYTYITDGIFETTDYMEEEIGRIGEFAPRDIDEKVFIEAFPTRIMLDQQIIWSGQKTISSSDDKRVETEVISGWFYDVYLRTDDHLIQQISFYNRNNPWNKSEIVTIRDIKYSEFEVENERTQTKQKYILPVRYLISFADDYQDQTYNVNLNYDDNWYEKISRKKFHLVLPGSQP